MRLFIAIELPADVRGHLVMLRDVLRPLLDKASLTRDQNLHITLKFLGDVDQRQESALVESLSKIRTAGPIEIRAEAIECFPPRGPLRIVAAGFAGAGAAAITALRQSIEQRCQHLGFEREQRAYRPHVTLARARPILPAALRARLIDASVAHLPGPALCVSEIALVASKLTPAGSEYLVIRRFNLADA